MRFLRSLGEWVFIALFMTLFLCWCFLPLHAQRSNTFYVDQFSGATVADKTVKAQAACNAGLNNCVLIFDPSLSIYPIGAMPAQGARETWLDYRNPAGTTPTVSVQCQGGGDLPQFKAAISLLTPNGGTISASGDCYFQTTTGTEALLFTAPINIVGGGSKPLRMLFNVPDTMDWIRVAPATAPGGTYGGASYYFRNVSWSDFTMVGASGPSTLTPTGRHAIVIDPTNGELNMFNLARLFIFDTKTGRGIYMNNTANSNGGWYLSTLKDSSIWNGIYLYQSGDSLHFVNNQIYGPNDGIYLRSIAGSAGNSIEGNNIITGGNPIVIDGATKPTIKGNEIGISSYLTDTSTATLWLKGTVEVLMPVIEDNFIGADQGIRPPSKPNVLVDGQTNQAKIRHNYFNPTPGYPAIQNKAVYTCVADNLMPRATNLQLLTNDGSLSSLSDCFGDEPLNAGVSAGRYLENRLLWSEDLTQSAWVKTNGGVASVPTVSQVSTTLPNGKTGNASRVQLALNGGTTGSDESLVIQNLTGLPNPHYSVNTVWIKSNVPGTTYKVLVGNYASGAGEVQTVGDNWRRVFVGIPSKVSGTTDMMRISIIGSAGGTYSNSADILVWGAQISSQLSPYVKTTTAAIGPDYGIPGRQLVGPVEAASLLVGSVGSNIGSIQHKRVTGCATAATVGAVCTVTVTWATAFPDTSYTAVCGGDVITSGVPASAGLSAKAAASVTFQTVAITAAAAQFTNVDCVAFHD